MVKAWWVKAKGVLCGEYSNNRLAYWLLILEKALCKCSVFNSSIINAIDEGVIARLLCIVSSDGSRPNALGPIRLIFWREAIKKESICLARLNWSMFVDYGAKANINPLHSIIKWRVQSSVAVAVDASMATNTDATSVCCLQRQSC